MAEPAYTVQHSSSDDAMPEHPLQTGLEYAQIARLYLADRGRKDLVHFIDLAIGEIEMEMSRSSPRPPA